MQPSSLEDADNRWTETESPNYCFSKNPLILTRLLKYSAPIISNYYAIKYKIITHLFKIILRQVAIFKSLSLGSVDKTRNEFDS